MNGGLQNKNTCNPLRIVQVLKSCVELLLLRGIPRHIILTNYITNGLILSIKGVPVGDYFSEKSIGPIQCVLVCLYFIYR